MWASAPRWPRPAEREERDSKALHRGRARRVGALAGCVGGLLCAIVAAAATTPPTATDGRDLPPSQPLVEGKQLFESKGCARLARTHALAVMIERAGRLRATLARSSAECGELQTSAARLHR